MGNMILSRMKIVRCAQRYNSIKEYCTILSSSNCSGGGGELTFTAETKAKRQVSYFTQCSEQY